MVAPGRAHAQRPAHCTAAAGQFSSSSFLLTDSQSRSALASGYSGSARATDGRHGRKTGETRISLNSHLLNDIEYCRLNHIVQMVLVTGKGSFAPNLKKWLAAVA